jgi:hypothetical protein
LMVTMLFEKNIWKIFFHFTKTLSTSRTSSLHDLRKHLVY